MKNLYRILSIFIAGVLSLALFPAAQAADSGNVCVSVTKNMAR